MLNQYPRLRRWHVAGGREREKQHRNPFSGGRELVDTRREKRDNDKLEREERHHKRLQFQDRARDKFLLVQTRRHVVHEFLIKNLNTDVCNIITAYWMTPVISWGDRLARRDENWTMSEETGSETDYKGSNHNPENGLYVYYDDSRPREGQTGKTRPREGHLWLDGNGYPGLHSLSTTHPEHAPFEYVRNACLCTGCQELVFVCRRDYPYGLTNPPDDRRAASCMSCRGLCKTCMDGPNPDRSCVTCYPHGLKYCKTYPDAMPGSPIDLTFAPSLAWRRRPLVNDRKATERDRRVEQSLENLGVESLGDQQAARWCRTYVPNPVGGPYGVIHKCDFSKNREDCYNKEERKKTWNVNSHMWGDSLSEDSEEQKNKRQARRNNKKGRRRQKKKRRLHNSEESPQEKEGSPQEEDRPGVRNSRAETESMFDGPRDSRGRARQGQVAGLLRAEDPEATQDYSGDA
jgi:hypothetical protein